MLATQGRQAELKKALPNCKITTQLPRGPAGPCGGVGEWRVCQGDEHRQSENPRPRPCGSSGGGFINGGGTPVGPPRGRSACVAPTRRRSGNWPASCTAVARTSKSTVVSRERCDGGSGVSGDASRYAIAACQAGTPPTEYLAEIDSFSHASM